MSSRIEVVGNVVQDPKLLGTENKVLVFNVADNYKEKVTFYNVKVFGKNIEWVRAKKGDPVLVQGFFDIETSEKDGKTYTNYTVVANRVLSLAKRDKTEEVSEKVEATPEEVTAF